MTLVESAVVLAWIAIALLSTGFAVLVRQTGLISRAISDQMDSSNTRGPNPVIGLRLPPNTALQPWLDLESHVLALYVSVACHSCRRYLTDCQKMEELRQIDQPVVVISRDVCPVEAEHLPSNWTCVEHAATEHERIHAPAVPYFAIIGSDRLVRSAGLAMPPEELVAMLKRIGEQD